MTNGINPIVPGSTEGAGRSGGSGGPSSTNFRNLLSKQIREANELQLDAEQAINDLAAGRTRNVTEAMAAVEKADVAFRNLMAVRNKIVDAYKEIQQLRI